MILGTLVFQQSKWKDQTNMVPYASAVGSLTDEKVWHYPKVVHISGLFLAMSSLDIDHWNGVKYIGLMLNWKEPVLSKGCEYKDRTCEMYSEIHNCR